MHRLALIFVRHFPKHQGRMRNDLGIKLEHWNEILSKGCRVTTIFRHFSSSDRPFGVIALRTYVSIYAEFRGRLRPCLVSCWVYEGASRSGFAFSLSTLLSVGFFSLPPVSPTCNSSSDVTAAFPTWYSRDLNFPPHTFVAVWSRVQESEEIWAGLFRQGAVVAKAGAGWLGREEGNLIYSSGDLKAAVQQTGRDRFKTWNC